MSKIFYSFLFFILLSFVGCTTNSKKTATYFGGKIINPKSNYVVLFSKGKAVDTSFLDKNNRFLIKFDTVKEGLYSFRHGLEYQYIYLEPKDSLMLRLNTWDFDESLVLAGKGAERNNILIDYFLEDEKDNKAFYQFNKLAPSLYRVKMDSLLNLKLIAYNNYIKSHPLETKGYKNLLKMALTYPVYARAERYPALYAKFSNSKEFTQLSKDFYKYRESINFDNDSLIYYDPYFRYIRNYLYNETYSLGYRLEENNFFSDFTIGLLNTINNKIHSQEIKNAFLRQIFISHFYKKTRGDINKKVFETFFKLSTNKEDREKVRKLLNDNIALSKGNKMESFYLTDFNNVQHKIKDLLRNKRVFLFFWNSENISKGYISSRINFLLNRFPKVHFLLVKIDGSKADKIQNLDIKNQFFIDSKSKANAFLTCKMSRTILINKNGIVENGYASIYSKNICFQLKELSKK